MKTLNRSFPLESASKKNGSLNQDIRELLNIPAHTPIRLTRLDGGGNNQVFKLTLKDSSYLLKKYFTHPNDPRDRLNAEWEFSLFLHKHGITSIPTPIAKDQRQHFAIYQFISGKTPPLTPTSQDHFNQALTFITSLQELRSHPSSKKIAPASEAAFSISEHIQTTETRFHQLEQAAQSSSHTPFKSWFWENLSPLWEQTRNTILQQAPKQIGSLNKKLPFTDRCLSPSDFGFHNTITEPNNHLTFIDFEYAGWDDPAKLCIDFFHHPAFTLPHNQEPHFIKQITNLYSNPDWHRQRIKILRPLYQLKWCCILLNPFLPVHQSRIKFALADQKLFLEKQNSRLQKAKVLEKKCRNEFRRLK